MTKTDYEIVGVALSTLPIGARVPSYNRLVAALEARNPEFDPQKFGECMSIPPLLRTHKKEKRNAR